MITITMKLKLTSHIASGINIADACEGARSVLELLAVEGYDFDDAERMVGRRLPVHDAHTREKLGEIIIGEGRMK